MRTSTKSGIDEALPFPVARSGPAGNSGVEQIRGSGDRHLIPYIVLTENALTHEFCDRVIGEFSDINEWRNARVGAQAEVNQNIRKVDVIELTKNTIHAKNVAVRAEIEQTLLAVAMKAVRQYQAMFPNCRIVEGRAFELLRYRSGGFYRKHTDSFAKEPRSLSCSMALNDDYSGGEWSFFSGEFTLRPPKGSVMLFPSNFMFPHEILEVRDGIRYSIVTWMI